MSNMVTGKYFALTAVVWLDDMEHGRSLTKPFELSIPFTLPYNEEGMEQEEFELLIKEHVKLSAALFFDEKMKDEEFVHSAHGRRWFVNYTRISYVQLTCPEFRAEPLYGDITEGQVFLLNGQVLQARRNFNVYTCYEEYLKKNGITPSTRSNDHAFVTVFIADLNGCVPDGSEAHSVYAIPSPVRLTPDTEYHKYWLYQRALYPENIVENAIRIVQSLNEAVYNHFRGNGYGGMETDSQLRSFKRELRSDDISMLLALSAVPGHLEKFLQTKVFSPAQLTYQMHSDLCALL